MRNRQVKNFLAVTLLSIGVPMILMGDEVRRTQGGNNNAYCHDNELNWFDWTLVAKHADVHRFVTLLNERRLLRSVEHERQRLSLAQLIQQAKKSWHGVKQGQPDWSPESRSVALQVEMKQERAVIYLILNAYWEPLDFELPPLNRGSQPMAPVDRYGAAVTARYCSVAHGSSQFRGHLPGAGSLRGCAVDRPERSVSVMGDPSAGRVAVDREMPAGVLTQE